MSTRKYSGNAVQTTLVSGISSGALTFELASATGWPDGSDGRFTATLDYGAATEEDVDCLSRTGTTVTIAGGGRAYDSSTAVAHSAGGVIRHTYTAVDAQAARDHIDATAAAHAATAISFTPASGIVATTVQTAVVEAKSDAEATAAAALAVHTADTTQPHSLLSILGLINVKDYGATGDGTTNDTTAVLAAALVANQASGVQALAGLYFPPGRYYLDQRITLGKTGARYNGPGFAGAGRHLTYIKWKGGTSDGPFRVLNGHLASARSITVGTDDSDKSLFNVWLSVEDGQSGFNPRTDDLHVHYSTYGLVVGAGTAAQLQNTASAALTATGQANQGLHTGFYASACDESARLIGANVECQTFLGYDFGHVNVNPKAVHSFNCRSVHLLGGEVDFTDPTAATIIFAEGASLAGGGFAIRDLRVEDAWCAVAIAKAADWSDSSGSSVEITLDNVMNQLDGSYVATDPCDMIRSAYQTTVQLREVTWPQPNSRVRFTGLNSDRNASVDVSGCKINHATIDTVPTDFIVLDAASPNADGEGVQLRTFGSYKISTAGTNLPTAHIPNVIASKTQGGGGRVRWETLPEVAGVQGGAKFLGYLETTEGTAPAAPAANGVRLYVVDNGGKTELLALFSSGAAQRVAIQP